MTIHKCDNCGKEMERKTLGISIGKELNVISSELCDVCALPIIEVLNQKHLLQDKLAKYLTTDKNTTGVI